MPRVGDAARFFGINAAEDRTPGKLKRYRVALPRRAGPCASRYEGMFDFGLSDQKEEYTRGFRETPGIVSEPRASTSPAAASGTRRSAATCVEFDLEVDAARGLARDQPGQRHVARRAGASRAGTRTVRWTRSTSSAARSHVYRDAAGAVETLVYLHEKDDALAGEVPRRRPRSTSRCTAA